MQLLGCEAAESRQKFHETMEKVVRLAGSLFQVVDTALLHIVKDSEKAITDAKVGEIRIPAAVLTAMRRVEQRKKADQPDPGDGKG